MKLGCLPYLNVKPLVWPLEHGELPEGWKLIYESPSALARLLAEKEIAAAPVSSFALFPNPELWVVPGICIASQGVVKSVLMVSKVEIPRIRTVSVDTSSLSGAAMLKIILKELYNLEPEYVPTAPNPSEMLKMADAAMVIGNPAMQMAVDGLHVLDLGDAWMQLTGLPAVFAVWAGSREALTPELIETLERAKETGQGKVDEICREEAPKLGLTYDACYDYLANTMKYDLGANEVESLEVFARKAYEQGLLDAEPKVRVKSGKRKVKSAKKVEC